MTKSLSVALKAHYAQPVTTIARCWKVTRTDDQVFGFTDFSLDLTVDGVLYEKATGITASNIKTSNKLDVDNLEVDSVLSADTITDTDLLAGLWDYAYVEIFEVNWADLTMGINPQRSGRIGEVRTGRTRFTAELRGLTQGLAQTIGSVYGVNCDADLGDARCKVDLSGFTATPTVTAVTDNANFTASALTHGTTYFDFGKVTFSTGLNAGLSMEVKTFLSGGSIELQLPMPYDVAIGDAFEIVAGCDKLPATCRDKFNNIINNRGYGMFVPGTDSMVSGT